MLFGSHGFLILFLDPPSAVPILPLPGLQEFRFAVIRASGPKPLPSVRGRDAGFCFLQDGLALISSPLSWRCLLRSRSSGVPTARSAKSLVTP
ncbi:hypothetical protein IWZ03DRAFT_376323 [Phyllosticta citriasiana]|uniref:Secreted protein n=1 Tax=Phyllosticta citriasiana TaxID=595635 RepID=A0ABR1KLX2_9PEZI